MCFRLSGGAAGCRVQHTLGHVHGSPGLSLSSALEMCLSSVGPCYSLVWRAGLQVWASCPGHQRPWPLLDCCLVEFSGLCDLLPLKPSCISHVGYSEPVPGFDDFGFLPVWPCFVLDQVLAVRAPPCSACKATGPCCTEECREPVRPGAGAAEGHVPHQGVVLSGCGSGCRQLRGRFVIGWCFVSCRRR